LLLNTCLTVEEGQPASHAGKGWEVLTDAVIASVSQHTSHAVFMLWGSHAQGKRSISSRQNAIWCLCANHPSPLSALRPPIPFHGLRALFAGTGLEGSAPGGVIRQNCRNWE
jgi:uracil-DNA glycosylase